MCRMEPKVSVGAILCLATFICCVSADGYGHGIAKNTYAASDPHMCYNFFHEYLPVRCQDSFACNASDPCMASGRVAFCNADSMTSETTCGMPTGGGPGGPPPDSGGPPNSGGLFSNWFGSIGPPPSGGPPGGGPPGNGPPPEGGPPPRGGGGGGPPSGGPPGSGFFSNVLGGGGSSGGGGPPGGNHGDFGLHTVNATTRPGHTELLAIEAAFEARFHAATLNNRYDPFLDFATVLYAQSLDRYLASFLADSVPFLLLSWADDKGNEYYSLLVRPCGQVILELVSATAPSTSLLTQLPHGGSSSVLRDPMPRLPASVFTATKALESDPRVLTVLAVSKGAAAGTMVRLDDFYLHTLQGDQSLYVKQRTSKDDSSSETTVSCYALKGATAAVRFVSRPDDGTGSGVYRKEIDPTSSSHLDAKNDLDVTKEHSNDELSSNDEEHSSVKLGDERAAAITVAFDAFAKDAAAADNAAADDAIQGSKTSGSGNEDNSSISESKGNDKNADKKKGDDSSKKQNDMGSVGRQLGESSIPLLHSLAATPQEGQKVDKLLSIADVENLKLELRLLFATEDHYCGVDKMMDNHFAWDQFEMDLNSLAAAFDAKNIPYHVFGGAGSFGPTNIYVTDPTGDSIQLDAPWTARPNAGSGDSLTNACSQGNCCAKGSVAASQDRQTSQLAAALAASPPGTWTSTSGGNSLSGSLKSLRQPTTTTNSAAAGDNSNNNNLQSPVVAAAVAAVGLAATRGSECAAALSRVAPKSATTTSATAATSTAAVPPPFTVKAPTSSFSASEGNSDDEEGARVRACSDAVYAPNARILLTAAGCTAADLVQHCESASTTESCSIHGPLGLGTESGDAAAGKDAKLVLLGSVVLLLCYCTSCVGALALARVLFTCALKCCTPAPRPVEDGTASSEASEAYDDDDSGGFNDDRRAHRRSGHGGEVELASSSGSSNHSKGGGSSGVALAAAATSEAAARIGGSLRGALEAAASRAHGQGQYAPLSPHAPDDDDDDDDDVGSDFLNRSQELEGGGGGMNSSVLENSANLSMNSFTEDSDIGNFLDGRTPMKAPHGEIVD